MSIARDRLREAREKAEAETAAAADRDVASLWVGRPVVWTGGPPYGLERGRGAVERVSRLEGEHWADVRWDDPGLDDEQVLLSELYQIGSSPLTPEQWCGIYGVEIRDPDGWRGELAPPWHRPIGLKEFHDRAGVSTVRLVQADAWDRIRADLFGTGRTDPPRPVLDQVRQQVDAAIAASAEQDTPTPAHRVALERQIQLEAAARGFVAPAEPQPAPAPNDLPHIADLVVADIHTRKAAGLREYGTPLQPRNGRRALVDLYQEIIDAALYLRQEIWEREHRPVAGYQLREVDIRDGTVWELYGDDLAGCFEDHSAHHRSERRPLYPGPWETMTPEMVAAGFPLVSETTRDTEDPEADESTSPAPPEPAAGGGAGAVLRRIRVESGLTQAQAAEKVSGVDRVRLVQVENFLGQVTADEVEKLLAAYGVSDPDLTERLITQAAGDLAYPKCSGCEHVLRTHTRTAGCLRCTCRNGRELDQ